MTASKHKDNDEQLLWTISEAAIHLGVHTRTVSRLIDKGILPSVRVGRCVRIPKQSVLEWIEYETRYNSRCAGLAVRNPKGERKCLSSANVRKASNNEKTARSGGHLSRTQAVEEFNALLGQPTRGKR